MELELEVYYIEGMMVGLAGADVDASCMMGKKGNDNYGVKRVRLTG